LLLVIGPRSPPGRFEAHLAQDLHPDTAKTHGQHRPEGRVDGDAGQQVARGCTAVSGPAKPAVAQLATMKRAHPELADAPTRAMLRGAKNWRSRRGVTSTREAR
jgi:hypothetical protein